MEKSKQQAWDILSQNEKQALQLVYGLNKTNLEAAVLMRIYPYKFTEIILRAKKFFRIFSEYFEFEESIIPTQIPIDPLFTEYINLTINNRLTPLEAINKVSDSLTLISNKNGILHGGFRSLSDEGCLDTLEVILTFDQWNCFRILPKSLQRPSPYPRRQNKVYKTIYNRITTVTELTDLLFTAKYKGNTPPLLYVPIVGQFIHTGVRVLSVPQSSEVMDYFSRNNFPMFINKEEALSLGTMSYEFFSLNKRTTPLARIFWPKFREIVAKAANLSKILKIEDYTEATEALLITKAIGAN